MSSGSSSASATVTLGHGWSAVAGSNSNSGAFNLNGSNAGGRGAYGRVDGQRLIRTYTARPAGGRIVSSSWAGTGNRETSRTSSRLTQSAVVQWPGREHVGLRTYGKLCLDIVLAPDRCSSTTSLTTNF